MGRYHLWGRRGRPPNSWLSYVVPSLQEAYGLTYAQIEKRLKAAGIEVVRGKDGWDDAKKSLQEHAKQGRRIQGPDILGDDLFRPTIEHIQGLQERGVLPDHPGPLRPYVGRVKDGERISPWCIIIGDVERRLESLEPVLREVLEALGSKSSRVTAAAWPGGLSGIDRPGLYAFWVDGEGARDLSRGVGLPVKAGLIYVGQAGAAGMGKSNSTLKKRIQNKHLDGRVRISTLRHTLAAALQQPTGAPGRADAVLAGGREELSRWMGEHLQIAVCSLNDRGALRDLERKVVDLLAPPLNLRGTRRTPLRNRLTELRRAFERGA